MVIERHRRDLRTRRRHTKNAKKCHYQGHVKDDDQSNVALSACDGIVSTSLSLSLANPRPRFTYSTLYPIAYPNVSLKEIIVDDDAHRFPVRLTVLCCGTNHKLTMQLARALLATRGVQRQYNNELTPRITRRHTIARSQVVQSVPFGAAHLSWCEIRTLYM